MGPGSGNLSAFRAAAAPTGNCGAVDGGRACRGQAPTLDLRAIARTARQARRPVAICYGPHVAPRGQSLASRPTLSPSLTSASEPPISHVVQPLIQLLEPTGTRGGVFHSHHRLTFVCPFTMGSARRLDSARRRRVSLHFVSFDVFYATKMLFPCLLSVLECAVPFSLLRVFNAF
jgi:hypothetical protein